MENNRNKCYYCICKTCAIAEINGGAPGCGNCKDCDLTDGCRSCNEYCNYSENIIRRERGLRSKLNLYDDACEMKKGVKMIIGIDLDNVLNNLCEAVLSVYNEDSGDDLRPENIHSYYIDNYVKPPYKDTFKNYFVDKRVWRRIKLIDDCQKYIAKLFSEGHTILFITSTEPENLPKKSGWLKRNFPYINIRKALFSCPKKQYMAGIDILIDDYEKNLIDAKYHGILFSAPWNKDFDNNKYGIYRAESWGQIYEIINYIDG